MVLIMPAAWRHWLLRLQKEAAQLDEEVLIAAAYLHDTIDDKVVPDVAIALTKLQNFLKEINFSAQQQAEIIFIITNMSFSKELEAKANLSIAGQIVQDADRLEALGAMGILRTAYFGGSHQHPLHDPMIKPINFTDKKNTEKALPLSIISMKNCCYYQIK